MRSFLPRILAHLEPLGLRPHVSPTAPTVPAAPALPAFQLVRLALCVALPGLLLMGGCASTPPYVYREVPGRTAILENGRACAPASAPAVVKRAIEAGNRIAGLPYRRGGGHGAGATDTAYDCSGSVSYVLREAGLLTGVGTSHTFRYYGEPGAGQWITVYARRGHVFMVVAGLRFDTGYNGTRGPVWTTRPRPAKKHALRHPKGY